MIFAQVGTFSKEKAPPDTVRLPEGSFTALVDTVDSTAAVFCNLIGNQRILTLVTSCHNNKHQIGQLGSQLFLEDTQNFLLKISIYLHFESGFLEDLWESISFHFIGFLQK